MKTEGYTVFHPQDHDLETQLAWYKGASAIVSTDNSALHLAAFVINPDCKIGILLRRPGAIFADFEMQLRWFAALIDFEKTARALKSAGIIENANWVNPSNADVDRAVEKLEADTETRFDEIFL